MGDLIDRIGTQFVIEGLNDIETGAEKIRQLGLEWTAASKLVGQSVVSYDAATNSLKQTTIEADNAARTFKQVQQTYQDVDLVAEQYDATQQRAAATSHDMAGKLLLLEGSLNAVKIGTLNLRQVAQSLSPEMAHLASQVATGADAMADMTAGMQRYQAAGNNMQKVMAGIPIAANAIALAVQATNAVVKDIDKATEHYEEFSKSIQFSGVAATKAQAVVNKAIREGWEEAGKYADANDRAAAAVLYLATQQKAEAMAANASLKPHAERMAQMDDEIARLDVIILKMRQQRGEKLSAEDEKKLLSREERLMTPEERQLKKMSEDWDKTRVVMDDIAAKQIAAKEAEAEKLKAIREEDAANQKAWAQAEAQRLQERGEYVPHSLKIVAGVFEDDAQNTQDWAEQQIDELKRLNRDVPAELRVLAKTYEDFEANRSQLAKEAYSWEDRSQSERQGGESAGGGAPPGGEGGRYESGEEQSQSMRESKQAGLERLTELSRSRRSAYDTGDTGLARQIEQQMASVAAAGDAGQLKRGYGGASVAAAKLADQQRVAGGGSGFGAQSSVALGGVGGFGAKKPGQSGFGGNNTSYVTIQSALGGAGMAGLGSATGSGPSETSQSMAEGGVESGRGTGEMGPLGVDTSIYGGGAERGGSGGLDLNVKTISEGGGGGGTVRPMGSDFPISDAGASADIVAGAGRTAAAESWAGQMRLAEKAAESLRSHGPERRVETIDRREALLAGATAGGAASRTNSLLELMLAAQQDGGYF